MSQDVGKLRCGIDKFHCIAKLDRKLKILYSNDINGKETLRFFFYERVLLIGHIYRYITNFYRTSYVSSYILIYCKTLQQTLNNFIF